MRPLVLVFVGPHGSGKTTLGRLASDALGLPFDAELGRALREEEQARDPALHAAREQEDFDAEVLRRELARDELRGPGCSRVVETWHPGNLAFLAKRSSRALEAARERLARHLEPWRSVVVVQPLTLSLDGVRARLTETGDCREKLARFFHEVGLAAVERARELGLHTLPAIDSEHATKEECLARVLWQLRPSRAATSASG